MKEYEYKLDGWVYVECIDRHILSSSGFIAAVTKQRDDYYTWYIYDENKNSRGSVARGDVYRDLEGYSKVDYAIKTVERIILSLTNEENKNNA